MARSRDIGQTCFSDSTYKHIRLTQDFRVNGSNEKFSEKYSGQKNNLSRNKTR